MRMTDVGVVHLCLHFVWMQPSREVPRSITPCGRTPYERFIDGITSSGCTPLMYLLSLSCNTPEHFDTTSGVRAPFDTAFDVILFVPRRQGLPGLDFWTLRSLGGWVASRTFFLDNAAELFRFDMSCFPGSMVKITLSHGIRSTHHLSQIPSPLTGKTDGCWETPSVAVSKAVSGLAAFLSGISPPSAQQLVMESDFVGSVVLLLGSIPGLVVSFH